MGRTFSGESHPSSPSCSFHSNCCCHGFAWQAAGEEEGGLEAPTPTKACKNKCATSTVLGTPKWMGTPRKESLSEGWGDEAGSSLGPGPSPSLACLSSSVLPRCMICLLVSTAVSALGGELGDSSLVPTAQHRTWYRSESSQLYKELSLSPWA